MAEGTARFGQAEEYRVDRGALCADASADLRHGEQGFDPVVHYCGSGELAACKRADFDGTVASSEQSLSAGDTAGVAASYAVGGVWGGGVATKRVSAVGAGGCASVSGCYRFDDEPRRGLAVYPSGPVYRASVRDGVVASGIPYRSLGDS